MSAPSTRMCCESTRRKSAACSCSCSSTSRTRSTRPSPPSSTPPGGQSRRAAAVVGPVVGAECAALVAVATTATTTSPTSRRWTTTMTMTTQVAGRPPERMLGPVDGPTTSATTRRAKVRRARRLWRAPRRRDQAAVTAAQRTAQRTAPPTLRRLACRACSARTPTMTTESRGRRTTPPVAQAPRAPAQPMWQYQRLQPRFLPQGKVRQARPKQTTMLFRRVRRVRVRDMWPPVLARVSLRTMGLGTTS
mmetsp:Transcript_75657/g.216612  ORF Transcript_75657/g.216612 Transcript_75657/m.216612 type:complete len:249 (-) Transcript_75657:387-1133(-)